MSSTATLPEEDELLQLPHNENHITFDFIAISLKKQEGIYYQYKLDGYDKEWSPPLVDNSATYTNLDPGDYEFLVRPSDNKMVWDSETTNFKFSIAKPFWNQSWFYASEIIFFLLLVGITYYSGKSRHKWIPRVMIYVCIFVIFEYIHTLFEPYLDNFVGGVPIFQVMIHLMLALALFPAERLIKRYFRKA